MKALQAKVKHLEDENSILRDCFKLDVRGGKSSI
jgi:hypothetical protein